PDQSLEWSDSGVEGAYRFLKRLWHAVTTHVAAGDAPALDPDALDDTQRELRCLIHDTIAKVTDDIERRYTFNTAIAAVMELSNHLSRHESDGPQDRAVLREGWRSIVQLMAPVAPHACEVLWAELGETGPLYAGPWPEADEAARVRASVTLVVQVNGKLRARLDLPAGADRDAALQAAMADDNVQRHLDGLDVRKVVHVPDRLLNIVAA
ncbi:MAG: class I tRNA ligase family protein, partial [Xanthomonadales bacterium]|nr:class I tRNA ligase family protein [Xanthomonadales bacterium]